MRFRQDRDGFDKFTERTRKVFSLAQEEAQRFNHNYIGTEHLLLGLLREGHGVAAKVLNNMGIELHDARKRVESIIGRGDRIVLGEIGFTPRAKEVIELSVDEARRLNHHYIGTEHLLLGLLREGEGIAAGVLESLGASLEKTRENVIMVLGQTDAPPRSTPRGAVVTSERSGAEPLGPAGGGPKSNVITCRIDDQDMDALDALVEAGIRQTRSDAASWLIHAGIETHRDLFARVYDTVAQIRQLRAQAQQMVQQSATETPEARSAISDEQNRPSATEQPKEPPAGPEQPQ